MREIERQRDRGEIYRDRWKKQKDREIDERNRKIERQMGEIERQRGRGERHSDRGESERHCDGGRGGERDIETEKQRDIADNKNPKQSWVAQASI